jgi:uncharacterized membrane protein YfcA
MADLLMILYVIAGIAVGFAAALLGLGGGFLMVPLLNLVFGFEIHQAIGTSLFSIVFTSSSSSIEYVRKRISDIKLGAIMIPFTIIGAFVGANLSVIIPANFLKAIFGIVLFISSVRMFLRETKPLFQSRKSPEESPLKRWCFERNFTDFDGNICEYAVSIPLIAYSQILPSKSVKFRSKHQRFKGDSSGDFLD